MNLAWRKAILKSSNKMCSLIHTNTFIPTIQFCTYSQSNCQLNSLITQNSSYNHIWVDKTGTTGGTLFIVVISTAINKNHIELKRKKKKFHWNHRMLFEWKSSIEDKPFRRLAPLIKFMRILFSLPNDFKNSKFTIQNHIISLGQIWKRKRRQYTKRRH